MQSSTVTATPAQLEEARKLLALFTDPNHPHRRGPAPEIEQARLAIAAEIEAQDADGISDATHEARYYLGLDCLECGEDLAEEYQLCAGYCSRGCYEAGGA